MIYFPKTNVKQSIKKQLLPKSDWEVYKVRRLAFKHIPDYMKALKKQKMALLTSGIDTDDEKDLKSKSKENKRKNYKQPLQPIEYNESGPSDEEDMSQSVVRYNMPPPLMLSESNNLTPAESSRSSSSTSSPHVQCQRGAYQTRHVPHAEYHSAVDSSTLCGVLDSPNNSSDCAQSVPLTAENDDFLNKTISACVASPNQSHMIPSSESAACGLLDVPRLMVETSPCSLTSSGDPLTTKNSSQTPLSASSSGQELFNGTPFRSINASAHCDLAVGTVNAEMMSKMTELVNIVKDVQEKQIIILAKLDQIPGTSLNDQSELELAQDLALPIQSVEDMANLAEVLKNDRSKRRKLRNYLSRVGGKTASEITNNILKACISYQTASLYSLVGQREKSSFQQHPLYRVVVQACMTGDKKASQKTFDDYISTFLKNAPSKEGCPKYKGKKSLPMANSLPAISSTDGSEDDTD